MNPNLKHLSRCLRRPDWLVNPSLPHKAVNHPYSSSERSVLSSHHAQNKSQSPYQGSSHLVWSFLQIHSATSGPLHLLRLPRTLFPEVHMLCSFPSWGSFSNYPISIAFSLGLNPLLSMGFFFAELIQLHLFIYVLSIFCHLFSHVRCKQENQK